MCPERSSIRAPPSRLGIGGWCRRSTHPVARNTTTVAIPSQRWSACGTAGRGTTVVSRLAARTGGGGGDWASGEITGAVYGRRARRSSRAGISRLYLPGKLVHCGRSNENDRSLPSVPPPRACRAHWPRRKHGVYSTIRKAIAKLPDLSRNPRSVGAFGREAQELLQLGG